MEAGRRNVGMPVFVSGVESAYWSKRLRSLSWTRKRTQVGSGGECFAGPYAWCASIRADVSVSTASFGGGVPERPESSAGLNSG